MQDKLTNERSLRAGSGISMFAIQTSGDVSEAGEGLESRWKNWRLAGENARPSLEGSILGLQLACCSKVASVHG